MRRSFELERGAEERRIRSLLTTVDEVNHDGCDLQMRGTAFREVLRSAPHLLDREWHRLTPSLPSPRDRRLLRPPRRSRPPAPARPQAGTTVAAPTHASRVPCRLSARAPTAA